jgi:class 3 adenylate cyclase
MSAPPAPPADPAPARARPTMADRLGRRRPPRRRLMERVSIQSKLMLMLLIMAVLATAVVGGIGFQSGRTSLREAVFDQLTSVREAQARVLELGLRDIMGSLRIYVAGQTVGDAMQAFSAGFSELASATITPAQNTALVNYYRTRFGGADGGRIDIDALLPDGNAARYLQANYTLAAGDRDGAVNRADAGDGSDWSAANARYNDYFREIVVGMQMRDALLIDPRGTVVYSAYKDVDLGTNVLTGPYRGEGGLADVFRKAMATNEVDFAAGTDFAEYLPAGEPTAWMVVPVGPPGRAAGVLALQYPIGVVNYLMTADRQWEDAGMGSTGETYLVGGDDLMRSDSRLFLEDREAYRRDVVKAGTPPETADRAIAQGTTVLVQPVGTRATDAAQRGETGTLIASDYLGHRALQAYAPLNLPGLDWIIIASIDSEEAFASERDFTQRLVRWTAIIILIACLAAMAWSRLFVRPIRRLEQGAEQIGTGNYDLALPVESRDEFGDLTVAFNEMSRNLAVKQQLLEEQRRENDRLLLSLMPQPVVDRYRDGEETIAAEHQDATVIFADLVGLDEMSGNLAAEESLQIINKLARQFDAAAESLGVERVRSTHNGYLASCGLTVPRLDNIHRTVEFAVEIARIVDRFNAESGQHLTLRAGIDTGTVSSGLVGRAGLVYDLWGGAVHLASKLRDGASEPGVYVSEDVYQATRDTMHYEPAGNVLTDDGRTRPVWRLGDG